MPQLGVPELLIIIVVALIIFGPGKLPEIGGALGRGIREFRESMSGIQEELDASQKALAEGLTGQPADKDADREKDSKG